MPSIEQINIAAATNKHYFVYGLSIDSLPEISEEVFLERFHKKRRLTVANKDYLNKDGYLQKDVNKKFFLTGCESSKRIIEKDFGIKLRLVKVAIWFFIETVLFKRTVFYLFFFSWHV